MIRVKLECEFSGHDFEIVRESFYSYDGEKPTETLDNLIRSAQASMNAALTARPESKP